MSRIILLLVLAVMNVNFSGCSSTSSAANVELNPDFRAMVHDHWVKVDNSIFYLKDRVVRVNGGVLKFEIIPSNRNCEYSVEFKVGNISYKKKGTGTSLIEVNIPKGNWKGIPISIKTGKAENELFLTVAKSTS